MPEGIILKGVGGFYEVLDKENNTSVYTCTVRGIHRKQGGMAPLVGDHVTFAIIDRETKEGHIDQILERKNSFIRPPVSNIDQLAIVFAVASPPPDLMLVDKLIITCLAKGIKPLIIINKSDLDDGKQLGYLKNVYQNTDIPVLILSKFNNECYNDLHNKLAGVSTAFAGQSGVGKSTILNAILNKWVMETGEVSNRIQRGKHTTRHVQLFRFNEGGFIFDTPGFSSFAFDGIGYESLADYYPEFKKTTEFCKFKGCSHTGEPDCAVRALYNDGIIEVGRYNRYIEFYRELKEVYDNRYRR